MPMHGAGPRRLRLYALPILFAAACSTKQPSDVDVAALPFQERLDSAAARAFTPHAASAPPTTPDDSLRLVRQLGDSSLFARVSSMVLLNGRLVVTDRSTDPHFAVVDLASGRVANRFGAHGSTEKAFIDPMFNGQVDSARNEAWVYDFQQKRLVTIQLSDPAAPHLGRVITLNARRKALNAVVVRDNVLANGLYGTSALVQFTNGGAATHRLSTPPFSGTGAFQLNIGWLMPSPSADRLVLAYQHQSRLDFFTKDGARYGSVMGPRQARARYHTDEKRRLLFWDTGDEMAFVGLTTTERYVYALFKGAGTSLGADKIQVLSWRGDFVREIQLDRPVGAILVSPDDTRLYAAFGRARVNQLGVWELPRETQVASR